MKRTLAAAITALLTGTSIWLGSAPADARSKPPKQPVNHSATIKVLTRWTYQGDGKLAVKASCSQRLDLAVVRSKMLPYPVSLRHGGNLLINVTDKTKPGRYAIALWCVPKGGRVHAQLTAAAAGTIDIGGDLTVNRLGFGAMRITGAGIWGDPPSRDQAIATLRRIVELGVNFIDTADSYGPEVSESLIAEALYPYPDDLVIATKGGLVRPGPNRWDADGRPEHLREACEGSLRRLRLEQIPLYQFHRPDPAVPLAESVGA